MEEPIARKKPIYLATLLEPSGRRMQYSFYAMSENGLSELAEQNEELAAIHHLPKAYSESLRASIEKKGMRKLGYIRYALKNGEATSKSYWPKNPNSMKYKAHTNWEKKVMGVRGLGAYLELISTHHLEKQGMKTISTTELPSIDRLMQLNKAGLAKLTKEELMELKESKSTDAISNLYEELRKKKLPVKAPIRDWKRGLGKVVKKGLDGSA